MRHESVSELTEQRLRETVAAFTPNELDMEQFGLKTSCGTTCCLAGKGALLFAPDKINWSSGQFDFDKNIQHMVNGEIVGTNVLGLTDDQSVCLFFVDEWPTAFQISYTYAETGEERLAALTGRVKHFITTSE